MRGRPPKYPVEEEVLEGSEAAIFTIAGVLEENCNIPGCRPKFHIENARVIYMKLLRLNLLKDGE